MLWHCCEYLQSTMNNDLPPAVVRVWTFSKRRCEGTLSGLKQWKWKCLPLGEPRGVRSMNRNILCCKFRLLSVFVNGCCTVDCHKMVDKKSSLHSLRFQLTDKEWYVKWVAAVNRKDWVPKQHARTCNKHFTTAMYSGDCLLEAS